MAVKIIRKDGQGNYTTISSFLGDAQPGDIGLIQDSSEYYESNNITKNNITIAADAGCSPTITAVGPVFTVYSGVTGFTLRGYSPDTPIIITDKLSNHERIQIAGNNGTTTLENLRITANNLGIVVSGNSGTTLKIKNCKATCVSSFIWADNAGILDVSDCSVIVTDGQPFLRANTFGGIIQRCYVTAAALHWPIGSGASYISNPIIRNILFKHNNQPWINPVIALWSNAPRVSECTFIRTDRNYYGCWFYGSGANGQQFRNCIVYGFEYAFGSSSSSQTNITSGCCAYNFRTAGWVVAQKQSTDIIADPKIIDFTTGALDPSSPCIDSGVDTGTPDDIRGVERPQWRGYDIGCWEYVPPKITYFPEFTEFNVYATDLEGNPIAGFLQPEAGTAYPPDLVTLGHLVMVSLLTDRFSRVEKSQYHGGWFADSLNDYPIGSRLWLLDGAPVTGNNIVVIKEYIEEALQWMLDDGIITDLDIEITTERYSDGTDSFLIRLILKRDEKTGIILTWKNLWGREVTI